MTVDSQHSKRSVQHSPDCLTALETKMSSPASSISATAYLKVILHACRYPSRSILGVLLGSVAKDGSVEVSDAIPAFHSNPLAPALEICFLQALINHSILLNFRCTVYLILQFNGDRRFLFVVLNF